MDLTLHRQMAADLDDATLLERAAAWRQEATDNERRAVELREVAALLEAIVAERSAGAVS